MRVDAEWTGIRAYTENGPVKAALVAIGEDYQPLRAPRKAETNLGSAGWTAGATRFGEHAQPAEPVPRIAAASTCAICSQAVPSP